MKGLVKCFGITVLALSGVAPGGTIDQGLEGIMASLSPDDEVSTLVFLRDQVDLPGLDARLTAERASPQRRHEEVVVALQQLAWATQGNLLSYLESLERGGQVQELRPFWIANAIRVDAPVRFIQELARRNDVGTIYFNYEIELIAPVGNPLDLSDDQHASQSPRAPEVGLVAVRAPEVWAMGFTGEGILIATLDTGVDGNHPALASRWRGLDPLYAGHPEWAWFDPVTYTTFPTSFGSHGTHTMGTACGGAPGDQIGVAPGAQWIHAAVIDRVSIPQTVHDALLAFEWLIDPDKNPSTNWDVPQVCSNSWRLKTSHGYPPCDQTFWNHLDACEAAGIVILFSAGNEGPNPNTIGRPPDRATDEYRTMAIGAVDANNPSWPIAGFSSRGPSYCTPTGDPAIKPELVAPGVNVRSSVPGGGYQWQGWNGTSMASPHVNGVVALMKQACPYLTVTEVKQILCATAHDLGPTGNDNDYGWGMVDAYEAVLMAQAMCGPHPPFAQNGSYSTEVNTPVTVTLKATDDGTPEPLVYIIVTLPAHGRLSDPAAGIITAVPYTLLNHGNQVIYQPWPSYQGGDSFTFKANDGGQPPTGGDSNIATITITVGGPRLLYSFKLDTNPGWTISGGQWAFGQPTGQGGTQHGYPDPNKGYTGTNVYGVNLNGDYSTTVGGPYYVTTAPVDLSNASKTSVRFRRWLNTDYQPYVYATIHVSKDNVNWADVWNNGSSEIVENSWSLREHSISATADYQPAVRLRWGYQIGSGAWAYSGWNIDDIEIWGVAPPPIVPGDLNCDGLVNFADINPFVLALSDPYGYGAAFPQCNWLNGDINSSGFVDFADIVPFVDLLSR